MNWASEWAGWITVVVGALVLLVGVLRKMLGAIKAGRKDLRAFKDAVLGREEILHPDTGAVLAVAVPGLGMRMATIEEAVVKMADERRRVDRLEERVATLEAKDIERALARTESIELMRTIDAALKANPEENQ